MEDSLTLIETYVIPWSIKIALALLIFVVGNLLARALTKVLTRVMQKARIDAILVNFLGSIFYVLLLIAVALAAIDGLGVNVTSLLAIVGAAGLAVGLALKDSLSNFAAGVMLIVFRPFRLGDFITTAGVSGVVDEIGMFSTMLHTSDNQRIIVPNSGVINGTIVNASALPTRRIDLFVTISYKDNIGKAKELISKLVMADARVLATPAFDIGVAELEAGGVKLFVQPWVRTPEYGATRAALIEQIKGTLEEAGFTIPYPQQDAFMRHINGKP